MSRVPTDADEEEIRRILETMWERTSRAEHETARGSTRSKAASIKLNMHGRDSGTRKYEPTLDQRRSDHKNHMGERCAKSPVARRSLFDVLNGATVSASEASDNSSQTSATENEGKKTNVIPIEKNGPIRLERDGLDGSPSSNASKQLSSLNYPTSETGGPSAATGGKVMHSPSEEGTNGNATELNGTSRKFDDGEPLKKRPLKPREETAAARQVSIQPQVAAPPAQPQPEPPPVAVNSTDPVGIVGEDTKRVMAPFKDTRMSRMSSPSSPGIPTGPPQAATNATPTPPPNSASVEIPILATTANPSPSARRANPATDTAAELMRPVLRQWLGENMPKIVESALEIEVAQSAKNNQEKKPEN